MWMREGREGKFKTKILGVRRKSEEGEERERGKKEDKVIFSREFQGQEKVTTVSWQAYRDTDLAV